MRDYCKVTLDLSKGSAYTYGPERKIPTEIKYQRRYDGKIQKGKIIGEFTDLEMHNVIYLIKRGYSKEEINETLNKQK